MKNAKIIGVYGVKGGVGKTTLVANLGLTLSNQFDKKVLVVDANTSTSDLPLHLGMLNLKNSLRDVIDGVIPLREAVFQCQENLFLMSVSLNKKQGKSLGKLRQYLNCLRPYYDVILLDSAPSINNEVLSSIVAADSLLCVATPDHPSLSCCLTALKHAKQKMTPVSGIILNKVKDKKYELDIETMEEVTSLPVLAKIKYNKHFKKSLAQMKPFVTSKPRHKNSEEIVNLAALIVDQKIENHNKNISKVEVNRAVVHI